MRIGTYVAALLLWSGALDAQIPSPRPAGHDCRVVLNKLSSDPRSEAFRWALMYGRVGACGSDGATAISRLLRTRAPEIASVGLLGALVLQASANRHPELFETALILASDRSQPNTVRVGAIQLALGQYDIGYRLPRNLSAPARPTETPACEFTIVVEFAYASEVPLPSNARDRLLTLGRALAGDANEAQPVQSAASCVKYILEVAEGPDDRTDEPLSSDEI